MTYDFDQIRLTLQTPQAAVGEPGLGDWLAESWRDPDTFAQALLRYERGLPGRSTRSRTHERLGLYHDAVERHPPDDVALRWRHNRSSWRQLTYGELDAVCAGRAVWWLDHGVEPESTVCLLFEMGIELIVSVLAALRLGLRFSLLPPRGPSWTMHRLAALAPRHVLTTRSHAACRSVAHTVLVDERPPARQPTAPAAALYPAHAVAARLFSSLHEPPDRVWPLTAAELQLGGLRDGLLLLGLRRNAHFAAPAHCPLQHQPALLLTALWAGATYVHLDLEDLAADPGLVDDFPLHAIGITAAVRDILLRQYRQPLRGWSHWFRDPTEPSGDIAWPQLIAAHDLSRVPCSNFVVDATTGGAVLFSHRAHGVVDARVLPVPGRPWSLQRSTGGPAREAFGDSGLLAAERPKRPAHIWLRRDGGVLVQVGTRGARRAGIVYPVEEIGACAAELPFIQAAIALVVPDAAGDQRIVVGLTGSHRPTLEDRAAVMQRIGVQLGAELIPDRVELYAFTAPRRGGQLDSPRIRSDFLSGKLDAKAREPIFGLTTLLGAALVVPDAM